VIFFLGKQDL